MMRPATGSLIAAAAVALVFGASAAHGQPSNDDERERPEVRSLALDGVRSVDEKELLESIATDQSRCKGPLFRPFCLVSRSPRWWEKHYLDPVELRRDILRIKVFYYKRGFREASVDTVVKRLGHDAIAVTFRIDEGPPTLVRVVRVLRPPSILADDRVGRLMVLRAGKPLSLIALDSSIVHLRNDVWNRGYGDAVLDTAIVVDSVARLADVTVRIDPRWRTVVGDIRVRGNEEVSERTIRSSLSFRTGDLYRREEITLSQRRLYESNLFRRAQIVIPPQGDSVKLIEITVAEAPHHVVRTSLGFNTVEFVQADGRFSRYNFFGGARRLDLHATLGNLLATQLNDQGIFRDVVGDLRVDERDKFLRPTWQLSAEFTQPWFLSHRNRLGASVFSHRRAAPGVFIDRGLGASATATREIMTSFPVSANYRFELTRVEAGDVYFCVNYGVCDPPTIAALRARQRLSPFLITGTAERTDNPFAPTRGYTTKFDLEHASALTLSDYRYNRAYAEFTYYRPIGGEGRGRVFAVHGAAGWVAALGSTGRAVGVQDLAGANRILHPRKRFYAGGSRSVRGLGENQLGPRVLTVAPGQLEFCAADTTRLPSAAELTHCDLGSPLARQHLRDRDFTPRPLGGNSLLLGSAEYRFPVYEKLFAAVFLDGAFVGNGSLRDVTRGAGALTPGFGVRYMSPVGAIRVDLGFNPTRPDDLPVITEVAENGERRIIQLPSRWRYDPAGSKGGVLGLLNRFTLHLSIGEAY